MLAKYRESGTNLTCGKTRIPTRPIFSSDPLKEQIGLQLRHCIGVTDEFEDVVTPMFLFYFISLRLFFQIAVKPFFQHLSLHCHINRECLSNS